MLALLADWLCAIGGLRHRHIQLSTPQRLSASTSHAWCSQGKQAHARKGFAWSVPAEFGSGFPWARKVLEAIQALPEDKRSSCGLAFDEEGVPYPISTLLCRRGHRSFLRTKWTPTPTEPSKVRKAEGAQLGPGLLSSSSSESFTPPQKRRHALQGHQCQSQRFLPKPSPLHVLC